MKHLDLFEAYWEKAAKQSQLKKQKEKNRIDTIRKHFPLYDKYIGKVVKYKGEYGIVVVQDNTLCVRWDTKKEFDSERLDGGNFIPEIASDQNYEFKWINRDGTLK